MRRRLEVVRGGPRALPCRLRGQARGGDGARRRQRRREVDADQERGRDPSVRRGRGAVRGTPRLHPRPAGRRQARHRGRLPGPRARGQPRRGGQHVPRPGTDPRRGRARRVEHGAGLARDPRQPVRHLAPLGPPDRGRPVRGSAAGGGRRQVGDVELEARDPRRAHRRPGGRADAPGARSRAQAGGARPRRGHRLPQPARHLRVRGPDHGAEARPAGGALRDWRRRTRRRSCTPSRRGS